MVARMVAAVEAARSLGGGADLACAVTHGRTHPVFGLWPVALRDALRRAMVEEEIRKVDLWTARYKLVEVAFPDVETPAGPLAPFFNTNRTEDLDEEARDLARKRAEKGKSGVVGVKIEGRRCIEKKTYTETYKNYL